VTSDRDRVERDWLLERLVTSQPTPQIRSRAHGERAESRAAPAGTRAARRRNPAGQHGRDERNIPARYVFGYLPDMDVPRDPAPMDFAAWMEVWLGDRWWTFDPCNNRRRKGRILIGRGRDASDVAMVSTFGAPLLESMSVHAAEVQA
jgi:hypothetical protein